MKVREFFKMFSLTFQLSNLEFGPQYLTAELKVINTTKACRVQQAYFSSISKEGERRCLADSMPHRLYNYCFYAKNKDYKIKPSKLYVYSTFHQKAAKVFSNNNSLVFTIPL